MHIRKMARRGPQLIDDLRRELAEAEALAASLRVTIGHLEKVER